MSLIQVYIICAFVFAVIINYNLTINLELNEDEQIKTIFDNLYIRIISILIISIPWIITMPIIIKYNLQHN